VSTRHSVCLWLLGAVACAPRPTADLSVITTPSLTTETPETPPHSGDPNKPRWVDLSIESEFGCAVERTGSVYCWGRGPSAEMALRELPEQPPADPMVYGNRKWGPASRLELIDDARRVSTSSSQACAVVEGGRVRCWGAMRWGSPHVYDIAGIDGATELEISDGESCALLADSQLWCWRAEEFGIPRPRLDGVTAMTVGDNVGCALTKSGDVLCWGQAIIDWHRYDAQFKQPTSPGLQPGTPPPSDREFPDLLEVGRFPGAVDIALTAWNSLCVLRTDGKVACAATDVTGLLRGEALALREVPNAEGLAELASTRTHTCGRTLDDRVLCWGRNVYGQLGDGGSLARDAAAPVRGLTGASDISVAEDFSCALTRDGRVACWGFDRGESLGYEPKHEHTLDSLTASSIAAFGRTTCAIDQAGKLRCWGSDTLEHGIAHVATPNEIALPSTGSVGSAGSTGSTAEIVALSTGWDGCVLLSSGTLHCGNWNAGPLQFSANTTLTDVHAYAAGMPPMCAIMGPAAKSQLRCGSSTAAFELERGVDSPTALSAANMRGCVVHGGGRVSCFGDLYYWGDQPPPARAFTRVEGIRDAIAVSSSTYHDCALRRSGNVSCWVGRTETKWSTDGRTPIANSYVASTVVDMGLDKITQLVAGSQHQCALLGNGGVRCWGDNPYAEGTEWKPVPDLDDIVQLAAGTDHTCARTRAGKITCWGDDVWGQLGRVPSRVYLEPTKMKID
jgi:alpha-tubulin suppressor-like RCC1 family protein